MSNPALTDRPPKQTGLALPIALIATSIVTFALGFGAPFVVLFATGGMAMPGNTLRSSGTTTITAEGESIGVFVETTGSWGTPTRDPLGVLRATDGAGRELTNSNNTMRSTIGINGRSWEQIGSIRTTPGDDVTIERDDAGQPLTPPVSFRQGGFAEPLITVTLLIIGSFAVTMLSVALFIAGTVVLCVRLIRR